MRYASLTIAAAFPFSNHPIRKGAEAGCLETPQSPSLDENGAVKT